MSARSVRRKCKAILSGVPVAEGSDVHDLCLVVGARRGRPVHVLPKPTSGGPSGVLLSLPEADWVFHEQRTSSLHRDHIVLHEIGHLLCEHTTGEPVSADTVRQLLPSLSAELVGRVLGRTTYSGVEEQEAEMMATLLARRTAKRRPFAAQPLAGADAPVVARIAEALDWRRR